MASDENSGFHLRWNSFWEEQFPDEWLLFIRKMKHSIQLELRSALERGIQSTPQHVSASYVNFLAHYSKYCKDWKECPPEDYMEKYFLLLNEECFFEILTENKFNAGNYIPSWVYDIMMKLLFSTMAQYRKSKDPLTLLQLCRRTLQHGQHQEVLAGLRFYFEKIKDPDLRIKLFNTKLINSAD
jgi:hypothetical protein